jgi:hypothetical protein
LGFIVSFIVHDMPEYLFFMVPIIILILAEAVLGIYGGITKLIQKSYIIGAVASVLMILAFFPILIFFALFYG